MFLLYILETESKTSLRNVLLLHALYLIDSNFLKCWFFNPCFKFNLLKWNKSSLLSFVQPVTTIARRKRKDMRQNKVRLKFFFFYSFLYSVSFIEN